MTTKHTDFEPAVGFRAVRVVAACLLVLTFGSPAFAGTTLTPTADGVTVETDRYHATIAGGVVKSFLNKLTGEEYLDTTADVSKVLPHLPAGLGTQEGEAAYASAGKIFRWPWLELAPDLDLPNQHFADASSKLEVKKIDDASVSLTYTNLSDGKNRYADEVYELTVAVEAETGDLVLTPAGRSAKAGVYGANIVLGPTRQLISVETAIFDGMQLTSDMPERLYHNKYPDYWSFPIIAMNGEKTGAVGVWSQDAELHYKDFFYRVKDKGIAMSFGTMSNPPFEKLSEAKGVSWHMQAFDKSWAQAAERYRGWRDKNLRIAPRQEWTQNISFVASGVNASSMWLNQLNSYFEGQNLDRTATFAATIRRRRFDTAHFDNEPYPGFKENMDAWKKSGAKLMAYLQPMIMAPGGDPPGPNEEDKKVIDISRAAHTVSVFTHEKGATYVDQHNLGYKPWQEWFLRWVKSYIQDHNADGIYHDQSYPCPVDSRGLMDGRNSIQGMNDYFFAAQSQNPNSIQGTEHMQEANLAGVSLGIGSGILWGSADGMRHQRIRHASPLQNAIAFPYAATWGFPHYSDFVTRGDAINYHWGMDLMERRGDLAGIPVQDSIFHGKAVPFDQWVNEMWLDRQRNLLFVRHGLRPVFPADWDRSVRTYFKGKDGSDFRYENTPWGSQFVEVKGAEKIAHFGRITGVTFAQTPGAIAGWPLYGEAGPAGLHPDRYYCVNPQAKRPDVYFSPAFHVLPGVPAQPTFYESYLEDGFVSDNIAMLKVKPLPSVGRIIGSDAVALHAPAAPKLVLIDGKPGAAAPQPDGTFLIGFQSPATIVVILQDAPADISQIKSAVRARAVNSVNQDVWTSAFVTGGISEKAAQGADPAGAPLTITATQIQGVKGFQMHIPVRSDKDQKLRLTVTGGGGLDELLINGVPQDIVRAVAKSQPIEIPFKTNDTRLLSITTDRQTGISLQWTP